MACSSGPEALLPKNPNEGISCALAWRAAEPGRKFECARSWSVGCGELRAPFASTRRPRGQASRLWLLLGRREGSEAARGMA
jgi:hypothetical protein